MKKREKQIMFRFKGMTPKEKRNFLLDYYVRRELSIRQIAIFTEVTPEAIWYWIKKFGLKDKDSL